MGTSQLPCRLEQELGLSGACPRDPCPFWEQGALGGRCMFETLDLHGRAQLAGWLLDLRRELEQDEETARRRFFERLNEGRAD